MKSYSTNDICSRIEDRQRVQNEKLEKAFDVLQCELNSKTMDLEYVKATINFIYRNTIEFDVTDI